MVVILNLFKRALFSAPGLSLRHAVPSSPPCHLQQMQCPHASCVCQINWEDKHSYKPPGCSKYCPPHHEYCQEITAAGGGESLQHNHFITSHGHCMCQGGTKAVLPKHSCSTEEATIIATIIRGIKSQWHKHISRRIHITNSSNDHQ